MSAENKNVATALKDHVVYPHYVQVKNQLRAKGFVCWIAGGAVRDLILGRIPADFDLVTDATTEKILEIFPEALTIGVQFGVVKLVLENQLFFDLATFRRESDYIDGRRPSHVDFATPEEDALRRDFTINALFWDDEKQQVVDFVGGLNDLQHGLIKCVGQSAVRFKEDHLRILRLLRFSIQFGFKVEAQTLQAATEQVKSLEKISGERIWNELIKMVDFICWSQFFKNSFVRIIFESLFPIQLPHSFSDQLENQFVRCDQITPSGVQNGLYKFFYFLLMLSRSYDVLVKNLRTRMKVSKSDLQILENFHFCLLNQPQLSDIEWLYEIEKNPQLLAVFEFLSYLQLPFNFIEIQKKYISRPPKVVDGNDLRGLVEHPQMGAVLKKIRLLQFVQPDLDKALILERLFQNKIISTKHKV